MLVCWPSICCYFLMLTIASEKTVIILDSCRDSLKRATEFVIKPNKGMSTFTCPVIIHVEHYLKKTKYLKIISGKKSMC